MKALFGEGRHPDAERLEREELAAGRTPEQARAAGYARLSLNVSTDNFARRLYRSEGFSAVEDRGDAETMVATLR